MEDSAAPRAARALILRLPRTFAPAFSDRLNQWNLLFPAEQRQFAAQVDWLVALPDTEFRQLFAPVVEIENKMDLPRWDPNAKEISVQQTGVLARSPFYSQWRDEVARVFSRVDEAASIGNALARVPRLVIGTLPAALPMANHPLWPGLAKQGVWIDLDKPWSAVEPRLLAALAGRRRPDGLEEIESMWVFECESRLLPLAESREVTVLSWAALEPLRRTFLTRLNRIRRDLKSVDDTNDELRRLDLRKLAGDPLSARPRLLEFVRSLLLSGNGSLVFPNSFVQWGAAEALRRAQPQITLAAFGMRQKIKPFSGSVLFEDQNRSNPAPDENDPAGSLIDAELLAEYVHFAAQRVPAFPGRTLTLLAAAELDRILVLGAKPAAVAGLQKWNVESVSALALDWLGRKV